MREAFVAVAQGYAQRQQPTSADAAKELNTLLSNVQDQTPAIGLPIGWDDRNWPKKDSSNGTLAGYWISKLIGFLLTAAATTLGAGFWFDMLKKLINVRASIKPEPPKPAAAPPSATGQ